MEVKNSLINTFWGFLKISQLIGHFPFKKGIDEATKFELIKPLDSCISFCTFTLSHSIMFGSLAIGVYISSSQMNLTMWNFLKSIYVDINETSLDTITWVITFPATTTISAILELKLFSQKKDIPILYNFYASSLKRILVIKPPIKNKIQYLFYGLVLTQILSAVMFCVGFYLYAAETTETLYFTHIIFLMGSFIFQFFQSSPLLILLILLCELAGNLCIWTETLVHTLKENDMARVLKTHLHECSQFYYGLKMTSQLFSQQMGIFTALFLGNLIIFVYRFLAFFLGNYEFNISLSFVAIGFGAIILLITYYMIFAIFVSQYVVDDVQNLVEVLQRLPIEYNQMACIDNELHPAMYVRELLAKKLESFYGFDAGGFCKLNKSIISSITANFITYVIVLIQFKTSENTLENRNSDVGSHLQNNTL